MATPEKGKRAIIKDRNSWGNQGTSPFCLHWLSTAEEETSVPKKTERGDSGRSSQLMAIFSHLAAVCRLSGGHFFSPFLSPHLPNPEDGELSWFISKARVEPFFTGCFLAVPLKSPPRAWMLTPVLLILLSRDYRHPSGKVPVPVWTGLSPSAPS